MYITPAAFLLFAEGDRHQNVADQHEVVCLPKELRVLFGQFLRQVGEVILAQAAKEECPLDDAVTLDRAVPLLLRVVEGFLLADQCNRIIEGVNRLNVSADRLLQAFKLSADLLCVLDRCRNMKGKIVKIEILDAGTADARIIFDIELEKLIDEREAGWYDLEYIGESEKGNSIVSFAVFQTKDEDEDDDGNVSRTVVPFQIAYAVSIHKAQGLEYTSVKLVITDEVDELITHNIFYTAITRTQNLLKIYWTPEVEEKVLKRIKPRNIDSDIELLAAYLGKLETEFLF